MTFVRLPQGYYQGWGFLIRHNGGWEVKKRMSTWNHVLHTASTLEEAKDWCRENWEGAGTPWATP
jgi:hypothetical protein